MGKKLYDMTNKREMDYLSDRMDELEDRVEKLSEFILSQHVVMRTMMQVNNIFRDGQNDNTLD